MKRLLRPFINFWLYMERRHAEFCRAHAAAHPETSAWAERHEDEALDAPSPVPGLFTRK